MGIEEIVDSAANYIFSKNYGESKYVSNSIDNLLKDRDMNKNDKRI